MNKKLDGQKPVPGLPIVPIPGISRGQRQYVDGGKLLEELLAQEYPNLDRDVAAIRAFPGLLKKTIEEAEARGARKEQEALIALVEAMIPACGEVAEEVALMIRARMKWS